MIDCSILTQDVLEELDEPIAISPAAIAARELEAFLAVNEIPCACPIELRESQGGGLECSSCGSPVVARTKREGACRDAAASSR